MDTRTYFSIASELAESVDRDEIEEIVRKRFRPYSRDQHIVTECFCCGLINDSEADEIYIYQGDVCCYECRDVIIEAETNMIYN